MASEDSGTPRRYSKRREKGAGLRRMKRCVQWNRHTFTVYGCVRGGDCWATVHGKKGKLRRLSVKDVVFATKPVQDEKSRKRLTASPIEIHSHMPGESKIGEDTDRS
ncbi:UNVERIFIED_CONTAM: hypothetical protein HHA_453640 [Hammondia hammondi]|eukprot:XP_008886911.1 hypothetical protein HHA_453640 [Hammondia hammondi]